MDPKSSTNEDSHGEARGLERRVVIFVLAFFAKLSFVVRERKLDGPLLISIFYWIYIITFLYLLKRRFKCALIWISNEKVSDFMIEHFKFLECLLLNSFFICCECFDFWFFSLHYLWIIFFSIWFFIVMYYYTTSDQI